MVDFAGWEMPVQYEGVRQEHLAVRRACGIFDVSHMGEIETSGPQALRAAAAPALQRRRRRSRSGARSTALLCREDGGVLDDLFTYRLDAERYLTVTNASNHERDLAWFAEQAARVPTPTSPTASRTTRCSPCRARSRASSCRRSPTRRCPRA